MSNVSFDLETMRLVSLFETITNSRVKDCFKEESVLFFVVQSGQMAKAIGKNGANVKKVQNLLKRDIRVIEFQEDPVQFIKSQIPLPVDVAMDASEIVITCPDTKTKGQVFGREKERYIRLQKLTKKYFPQLSIKVV